METAPDYEYPALADASVVIVKIWKEVNEEWIDSELKFNRNSYGNFDEPKSEVLVDGLWYYKIDDCAFKIYEKNDDTLPGGESSPKSECCMTYIRNIRNGFTD